MSAPTVTYETRRIENPVPSMGGSIGQIQHLGQQGWRLCAIIKEFSVATRTKVPVAYLQREKVE